MLPWPPSVNSYWHHTRTGHTYVSQKGREYSDLVAHIVRTCGLVAPAGLLSVEIHAVPPDRRTRDLGNLDKALGDSLTRAGFWEDDSLIDRLSFQRRGVEWPGRLEIYVESTEAQP